MKIPRTRLAVAALLLAVTLASADDLRTLGSKTVSGTVVGVTDKEITVRTAGGMTVATPIAQVLALELRPVKGVAASTKYSDVRLSDDTLLHCKAVAFKGKDVHLTLLSGQEVKVPLSSLTHYFRDAHDSVLRKEWDTILGREEVKRDRVVILKNDELNAVEGTFGDVSPDGQAIQFRLEGGLIRPVPFTNIGGMVFYRLDGPTKSPICQVHDVQGNSLAAVAVKLDGNTFTVTTTGGIDIRYDHQAIARFDYNMGKLTYLSDLEPTKKVERSGVGLPIAYRKDTNLDGDQILLGDKIFPKGLSIHAYTELEYALGGRYKEFRTFIGVDPRVGPESKAVVVIERDGREVYKGEFTAETPLREVRLPMQKANRLRITVSSSNLLDLHDHVTFADARVSQ